jgi:hypothetical protein
MKSTKVAPEGQGLGRAARGKSKRNKERTAANRHVGRPSPLKVKVSPKPLTSPAPGQLLVDIDGKAKSLTRKELLDGKAFTEWQDKCNAAHDAVVLHLNHLLDFTNEERFRVLDLIASLNVRPKFVVETSTEPGDDLLTAVLGLMPDTKDIEKFGRGKMAALEVAALLHPDALEVACGRVLQAMRDRGVKGLGAADLVRDAREIAEQLSLSRAQASGPEPPRLLKDVLPDAPVPAETKIPPGWDVTATSILSWRKGIVGEISSPIAIAGRGRDTARGTEHVWLVWFREGAWHQRIVEREILANTQKILALAAFGLPVTSNSAKLVVQYLADFEAVNMEVLPVAKVSRKLGYQGHNGDKGFLWGRTLITAKGFQEGNNLNQLAPEEWSQQAVHFQGADEGDDQIAAGFHAAGTYAGWCKAMQAVAPYPKVKLAFYAGLSAPLLPVLHATNFIVDLAGETTSGKTVSLRVTTSSFGNPDEESANGSATAMFTWKNTAVWKERAPVVVNHLPFIMDDTKHATHTEDVAETIYTIAQGRSKGRGTIKGTAAQETFSTVMLSSGEQPATGFTQDGGTRARVITLWGSPFGARNQKTGKLVRRLNDRIKHHYGHAGPRFVQFILKNRKHWKKWREEYQQFVDMWEEQAGGNAIAGRLAACFAAISVTASLVHEALDLPWEYEDPIAPLWRELVREASDQAAKALQYVMAWAYAHRDEFSGRRGDELPPPAQGWVGRWEMVRSYDDLEWAEVAFLPPRIHTVLRDGGYEPDSIIRTWKGRGWLHTEKDKDGTVRTERHTRLGRDNPRMVVITKAAVKAAEKAT